MEFFCPKCNAHNQEGAVYCGNCGFALPLKDNTFSILSKITGAIVLFIVVLLIISISIVAYKTAQRKAKETVVITPTPAKTMNHSLKLFSNYRLPKDKVISAFYPEKNIAYLINLRPYIDTGPDTYKTRITNIEKVNVITGETQLIKKSEPGYWLFGAQTSRNGQYILYFSAKNVESAPGMAEEKLHLMKSDRSTERIVEGSAFEYSFNPDNASFVYVDGLFGGNLIQEDIATGSKKTLATDSTVTLNGWLFVEFSPDGKYLIYPGAINDDGKSWTLWLMDLNSKAKHSIFENGLRGYKNANYSISFSTVQWSPDNKTIFIDYTVPVNAPEGNAPEECHGLLYNLQTRAIIDLSKLNLNCDDGASFSPDGKQLIISIKQAAKHYLATIGLNGRQGTTEQELPKDSEGEYGYYSVYWPDQNTIYIEDVTHGIWQYIIF